MGRTTSSSLGIRWLVDQIEISINRGNVEEEIRRATPPFERGCPGAGSSTEARRHRCPGSYLVHHRRSAPLVIVAVAPLVIVAIAPSAIVTSLRSAPLRSASLRL